MCKDWILDPVRTTQNKIESEKPFSSYNLYFKQLISINNYY